MGQVNKDGLKLICTHQLMVFVADVNIIERKLLAIKKNIEAFLVASKENGIEVNAVKTTYVVMSRDQNSRRIQNTNFILFPLKG
jgi:uncharacterized protein (UPF0335 family)